jgi:hypothetical protein
MEHLAFLERDLASIRADLDILRTALADAWDRKAPAAECEAIRAEIARIEDGPEDFAEWRWRQEWTRLGKPVPK